MFPKEMINYQDKLYWVYRKVKTHHIKESYIQDIKDLWSCDVVLRHRNMENEYLYFLRCIPDVELIVD